MLKEKIKEILEGIHKEIHGKETEAEREMCEVAHLIDVLDERLEKYQELPFKKRLKKNENT